jgi:hypothetical protein
MLISDEPLGPNSLKLPGSWAGVLPDEPAQFTSEAAVTASELAGVDGVHWAEGICPARTRSLHGLLLLAWNWLGVVSVVSVASNDPM